MLRETKEKRWNWLLRNQKQKKKKRNLETNISPELRR